MKPPKAQPLAAVATTIICLLASPVAADDSTAAPEVPFRLRVSIEYVHKFVLGDLSEDWGPAHAAGLSLSLATPVPRLSASVGAEIASLPSRADPARELVLLEFTCAARYAWFPLGWRLGAEINAGLTSSLVGWPSSLELERQVFNTSESEFGLRTGLAPVLRLSRFRLSVPLTLVCILSAPEPFVHLDLGVRTSVEF
jgi:hypothetical protein